MVFWHVLDDGADGIALLDTLLDRYDSNADYVVVKNYGRGKNFSAYDASAAQARAQVLEATVIELPDLHAGTMRKIDHSNASLWAAAHTKDLGLGMMDRQRVKVWTNQVYRQFDPVAAGSSPRRRRRSTRPPPPPDPQPPDPRAHRPGPPAGRPRDLACAGSGRPDLRARLLPKAQRIDPDELAGLGEHYAQGTGYPIQYQWVVAPMR